MKKIVTGIIILCIIFHCSLLEDQVEKKTKKQMDRNVFLCMLIANNLITDRETLGVVDFACVVKYTDEE